MPIERHFLGWDAPALPRAVVWLRDRFGDDMSGVTVVTPGGRAGRRLLELLVGATPGGALQPPRLITAGSLPERLYGSDDPVADPVACLLAWVAVLRDADDATVQQLTPQRPAYDDALGWLDLAEELASLRERLAAEGKSAADAAAIGPERWRAVATLEQAYEQRLTAAQQVDKHAARRLALETREHEPPAEPLDPCDTIVLLGTVELPAVARRLLAACGESVHALVVAPESEADAFHDDGTLRAEAWVDRRVAIDDARLRTVDGPTDQARAALGAIAEVAGEGERTADAVTIGLGDEALGPTLRRVLDEAGVPVRLVAGRPVTGSRPARLLSATGRYARSRRWSDFAALLRQPDVESWLMEGGAVLPDDLGDALSLLDRYLNDHLQGRTTAGWLGERGPRIKAVHDAVWSLLPDQPSQRRPIAAWADPFAKTLAAVYGRATLNHFDPGDAALIHALGAIGGAIDTLRAVADESLTLDAASWVDLLMTQLADQSIPPASGGPAVELLGFLELPLDDAPVAIVAGINEGAIPSSITGDPLLPGSLRGRLGLPDNRARYARDLYALTVVLQSRPDTLLITARRGADDEPLRPSRLLLAADEPTMAARLARFYDEAEAAPAPPLLVAGQRDKTRLLVPRPEPLDQPIDRLPVTAFRDYLACPYRFYLKHVLKLESVDDRGAEMDGGQFGSLVHRVLRAFGQEPDLHTQTRPEAIAAFLNDRLTREARAMYGPEPSAAVILQAEQLRSRLEAFARWQAQQAAAGWRIVPEHVEQRREAELEVDGRTFTVTGQIDRVDLHDALGYRILDYKSRDVAEPPEKTHCRGRGADLEWVDLQLPLYRRLAAAAGVGGALEMGYVLLPRKVSEVGWYPAPWDGAALDAAEAVAAEVVRAVRGEVFWPPADAPPFADGLEWICCDDIADRGAVLGT